jgi:dTDP-4-dehydrorhamnose reductase
MRTPSPQCWALLGSRGQLGQELLRTLADDVVELPRTSIDLGRPHTIRGVLHALCPRGVVNCAAYNLVDDAESDPSAAFAVNTIAVLALAQCCRKLDCPLVHFSTDYVFGLDVTRNLPYREVDCPGPVNVYGSSKLAGECLVRALCPKHFVIRTCGLYGPHATSARRNNFVEAIRRRAMEGAILRVVDDQRCTPTSAADLARAVAALLSTDRYGLYHYTNSGSCTWYEFAQAIIVQTGSGATVVPISSAAYGAAARRPQYSELDCSIFDGLELAPRRPWADALAEYL